MDDFAVAEFIVEDAVAACEERSAFAHDFAFNGRAALYFRGEAAAVPMAGSSCACCADLAANLDIFFGEFIDEA